MEAKTKTLRMGQRDRLSSYIRHGHARKHLSLDGSIQPPARAEICGAIFALAAGKPAMMANDNSESINLSERSRLKDRPFNFYKKASEGLV